MEGGLVATVKTVGKSGQIALGKEFAGKHVLVDELEPGVWMIKVGEFIPENERWLHRADVRSALDEGLEWASKTEPSETDLDDLKSRLGL